MIIPGVCNGVYKRGVAQLPDLENLMGGKDQGKEVSWV